METRFLIMTAQAGVEIAMGKAEFAIFLKSRIFFCKKSSFRVTTDRIVALISSSDAERSISGRGNAAIADKSIERKFVEELDVAEEVCVYAKLPKGFYIPTPVGNYSPDWAIAFNEGAVKHIFFVAETKGTTVFIV